MDSARAARAGMLDRLTEVVRAAGEEIESAHHALEQLEQAIREALTPEHVLAEALDAARAIKDEFWRAQLLVVLASRLSTLVAPEASQAEPLLADPERRLEAVPDQVRQLHRDRHDEADQQTVARLREALQREHPEAFDRRGRL